MGGDPFIRAWSAETPGAVGHPGPRGNLWPGREQAWSEGPCEVPAVSMARALWWSGHFHPDPATGRPGTVRQRAVPSAGGCYPVQVHLLCGDGCDVPPGTYAFDAATGQAVRRDRPGTSVLPAGLRGAVLVFTALPQRTAAKYHHRTLPLLIADAAYAAAALAHHAASRRVDAAFLRESPDVFAAALGMPAYGEWLEHWPDTAPEVPLAAVALGGVPSDVLRRTAGLPRTAAPVPVPERRPRMLPDVERWVTRYRPVPRAVRYEGLRGAGAAVLAGRRSASLVPSAAPGTHPMRDSLESLLAEARNASPFAAPPACRAVVLDAGTPLGRKQLQDPRLAERCAGQRWIGTLDGLVLFQTRTAPGAEEMWWAASLAAHVLFNGHARPFGVPAQDGFSLAFRAVGGWTGTYGGSWILHGLGMRVVPSSDTLPGSGAAVGAGANPERTGHAG